MADDSFETVAITYRQPETAVILSMLEAYGIPAYALGAETARTVPPYTLALGGIRIRVPNSDAADARALLNEAAERESEIPPDDLEGRIGNGLLSFVMTILGGTPPPRLGATIVE